MPVRFTTPSLGEIRSPQVKAHQWQFDAAFRHLGADQWFVGTDVKESAAPFGKPLFLDINSVVLNLNYGITDRTSVAFTLPLSHGTHSRFYADGKRHTVSATGIGDISLVANHWLLDFGKHPRGNVAFGLGVKMPTGDDSVNDSFFLANGAVIQSPVDQSIQPGDGGWGMIFQTSAYRALFQRASVFVNGWYLLSPKEKTNVPSPLPGVTLSVPDVYSLRFGTAYALAPKKGVAVSLGARFDGIPLRDLVGGNEGFRRPGYSLYIEPGASFVRGRGAYNISVPVRVHQNFRRSLADTQLNRPGGGDLARYLFLVGYSFRF